MHPLDIKGVTFMTVDKKRAETMRKRLGDASELVNNDQYLPRARAVQKQLNDAEWATLVKMAKKAEKSAHYFMKLIAKANFSRTMETVHKLMNGIADMAKIAANKAKKVLKAVNMRRYTPTIHETRHESNSKPVITSIGAGLEEFKRRRMGLGI